MADTVTEERTHRGQLARAFEKAKVTLDDAEQARVATADAYLDEAFDQLDEEPTLSTWLGTDYELGEVRWAAWSAIYWVVMKAVNEGVKLDTIVSYLMEQIGRIQAATAFNAVMHERKRASENP